MSIRTFLRPYRNWLRTLWEMVCANPWAAIAEVLVTTVLGVQPALGFFAFSGLIDALTRGLFHGGRGGLGAAAGKWLALVALFALLEKAGQRVRPLLKDRLKQDTELRLTERLLERAGRTPLLAFESPEFFDRYARAAQGVRENLGRVSDFVEMTAQSVIAMLSMLGVLASLSPTAVALLLVAGGPAWLLQAKQAKEWVAMWRRQTAQRRRMDYLSSLLLTRRFAQEVRLFQLGEYFTRLWRKESDAVLAERVRIVTRRGWIQVLTGSISDMAFVGALGLLGVAAFAGRISVGRFAAAVDVTRNVGSAVQSVLMQLGMLQQDAQFITDLWEFIDDTEALQGPPMDEAPPEPEQVPAAEVRFESVSFQYPGASRPNLFRVSFTVRPGELIALVGENGAGKSTLVKLLLGLYTPSAGSVRVDGVEISAPEAAPVRARIASVFQDYLRYALTAAENIGVGAVGAMDDRLRIAWAAEGSGAAPVIEGLPRGYDSQLGREFEGGQELSGGQWQKLSIARAYMRRAAVLVLDEPTAALDPQAELEVFHRFRELANGRTAFFISHRLGAARLADRILVLKHGELVEVGHHDELIARGGEYASLFEAQAAWYR